MKLLDTPIIKLTFVLLTGIITGFYADIPVWAVLLFLLVSLPAFIFSYIRAKNQLFPDRIFGVVTLMLFFVIGVFTSTIHLPRNQNNHFVKAYASENYLEKTPVLELEVREELKPDLFHHKYIAEVNSVSNHSTHGKILILIPKDSLTLKPVVGNRFLLANEIREIQKPLNPYQFNYNKYMATRGVLNQTTLKKDHFKELPAKKGLFATAASWRKTITEQLKQDGIKPDELAIVQALLLGQKQDISAETYNNYAAAGAIHILAVSGLHVGILLLLLNRLFSPLSRIKKGKLIRTILVLIILWGFAVLAGLSPSVVRAVTMFSFLAVALELKRRTSSLNSLFLSMLLLLLIRPQWIYEVGFQLSYSAVLAIILLQPVLFRLLPSSNTIVRFFWGILTTTIAAQVGVLPLSLFYFHQFPGLFFLSNLVILPFLGLILGAGILVMILSLTGFSHPFLIEGFNEVIAVLNSFVATVARQEQFLFQDIPFDLPEVWGWYLLLLCLVFLIRALTFRKIIAMLLAIILLQSFYLYEATAVQEEKLIVFHRARSSIIAKKKKNQLIVYQTPKDGENKIIRNYIVGEEIQDVKFSTYWQFFSVNKKVMMVIDSTGIFPEFIKPDYLLLTGSPRFNLDRVIDILQPQIIVADGSNYPGMISNWKQTAIQKKIPFHYTGEKGAFKLP